MSGDVALGAMMQRYRRHRAKVASVSRSKKAIEIRDVLIQQARPERWPLLASLLFRDADGRGRVVNRSLGPYFANVTTAAADTPACRVTSLL